MLKERTVDLLSLGDALNGLARLDPQQCRIVELRFFGGLTLEETAQDLNISPTTVKRDWATARIWLHHQTGGRVGINDCRLPIEKLSAISFQRAFKTLRVPDLKAENR